MIKLCILFQRHEINLLLNHQPEVMRDQIGRITGISFQKDDVESIHGYLLYTDWNRVEAVLQYPEEAMKRKEDAEHGKETG